MERNMQRILKRFGRKDPQPGLEAGRKGCLDKVTPECNHEERENQASKEYGVKVF